MAGLLAALLVPWTIIFYPNGTTYVFAWALVNADPIHITTIFEYVFVRTSGLPRHLLAWPVSALLFTLGLVSTVAGSVWNREDTMVAAGLLAFAGVSHATFALGLQRPGIVAIPLGTGLLWMLAGYVYFLSPGVRRYIETNYQR